MPASFFLPLLMEVDFQFRAWVCVYEQGDTVYSLLFEKAKFLIEKLVPLLANLTKMFWMCWRIFNTCSYFFFFKFLLLFNYSCMPFLPIPPPHPSWTHLPPHLHPPPWFCPCVLYSSSCALISKDRGIRFTSVYSIHFKQRLSLKGAQEDRPVKLLNAINSGSILEWESKIWPDFCQKKT